MIEQNWIGTAVAPVAKAQLYLVRRFALRKDSNPRAFSGERPRHASIAAHIDRLFLLVLESALGAVERDGVTLPRRMGNQ